MSDPIETLRIEYRALRTRALDSGASASEFRAYVEASARQMVWHNEELKDCGIFKVNHDPNYTFAQACCEAADDFVTQAEIKVASGKYDDDEQAAEAAYEAACDAEAREEAAMPYYVGLIPGTAHVGE